MLATLFMAEEQELLAKANMVTSHSGGGPEWLNNQGGYMLRLSDDECFLVC